MTISIFFNNFCFVTFIRVVLIVLISLWSSVPCVMESWRPWNHWLTILLLRHSQLSLQEQCHCWYLHTAVLTRGCWSVYPLAFGCELGMYFYNFILEPVGNQGMIKNISWQRFTINISQRRDQSQTCQNENGQIRRHGACFDTRRVKRLLLCKENVDPVNP